MREKPHVRICAGGGEKSPSLPRPTWAVHQFGSYLRYTGGAVDVSARAGSDSRPAQSLKVWNIGCGLLRPDVRRPDQLAPPLGFCGDELAEISGRAHKHRGTEVGEPRLDFGIGKAGVY